MQILYKSEVVVERFVKLEDMMLFSESTRSKISHRRKWIEDFRFYLFTKSAISAETIKGAVVETSYTYGNYYVYYVIRTGNELIIAGEEELKLFEPDFIHLRLDNLDIYDEGNNVYYYLENWAVCGLTNIEAEKIKLNIYLFRREELIYSLNWCSSLNKTYLGLYSFLLDKNVLYPNLSPGRYTLVVETDNVQSSPVTFSYIPSPDTLYGTEHTYAEGEQVIITGKWNKHFISSKVRALVEQNINNKKITCRPVPIKADFNLFKCGIVDFPARYYFSFVPTVFGIRILHPHLYGTNSSEGVITHPDREDLEKAVLYIFGRPSKEVIIKLRSKSVRYELDAAGELRIPLSFLKKDIRNHINELVVSSEGIEKRIIIRWWPIAKGTFKAVRFRTSVYYEITVLGPTDLNLEVRMTDLFGKVLQTTKHELKGKMETINGYLKFVHSARYIILGYVLNDTFISLHVQAEIPDKSIPCGIGVGVDGSRLIARTTARFKGEAEK